MSFSILLNGIIKLDDLIQLCNEKFLKFDRLKSILTDNGVFEEISNYDCKRNIIEYKVNEYFPINNQKSSNKILMNYSVHENTHEMKFKDKPLWLIKLYQYKNVSVLVTIFHHCIGDGNTFAELIKQLCNIPSNLTNNTQLVGHSFKKYNLFIRIYLMIRYVINFFRFINKFMFHVLGKYYWNKWFYSRNKKYIFEPENGLSVCMRLYIILF